MERCSRGLPFRQLKQSDARLFRKSLCNLIPRIERLLQGEVRFDSLLDLAKRETEFTGRTTWSPTPRVGSPRGNISPDADQFLCEESDKQFPIKPSAGTATLMLGHVPQLGEALQSLKHQLNLPTHTVRSQNVCRRTAGSGRKHDHVLSKFECSRPCDHLLLTRFALQAPMRL